MDMARVNRGLEDGSAASDVPEEGVNADNLQDLSNSLLSDTIWPSRCNSSLMHKAGGDWGMAKFSVCDVRRCCKSGMRARGEDGTATTADDSISAGLCVAGEAEHVAPRLQQTTCRLIHHCQCVNTRGIS